MSVLCCT
jgi:hypothetical protein